MIAFEVADLTAGQRLIDHLTLCQVMVSLGDVMTIIQHSTSITHSVVPRERLLAAWVIDGLL